jgi:biopolymer transport protein ExbD
LITFFMLVINFKAAETDASVKLPVVGSARPVDNKAVGELLVLNLTSDGRLRARGKDEPSIEGFIRAEKKFIERTLKNYKEGDELPITVVIRADRTTPVRNLMRVVTACQAEGCRKFDFMVMRQAREATPGGGT